MIQIITWNINGMNAALKRGLLDFIAKEDVDIYCFQETKLTPETFPAELATLPNYRVFFNHAEKKGYSGVLTLSKVPPISESKGMGISKFDQEGRILTLEYPTFYLVNAYVPNAGRGLPKLEYKLEFDQVFLKFSEKLRKKKPVVITGDLNVAHTELDIARPKENKRSAGFTQEERDDFTNFLNQGYLDTFRMFESGGGHYTWWSMRSNARENNIGWRLDYFVVSDEFKSHILESKIRNDIFESDHCPIQLVIK